MLLHPVLSRGVLLSGISSYIRPVCIAMVLGPRLVRAVAVVVALAARCTLAPYSRSRTRTSSSCRCPSSWHVTRPAAPAPAKEAAARPPASLSPVETKQPPTSLQQQKQTACQQQRNSACSTPRPCARSGQQIPDVEDRGRIRGTDGGVEPAPGDGAPSRGGAPSGLKPCQRPRGHRNLNGILPQGHGAPSRGAEPRKPLSSRTS